MDEILFNKNVIELKERLYKIGRHEDCEIKATSKFVSKIACTLYKLDSGEWALISGDPDIDNSRNKNGIRINGKVVDAEYGVILKHTDLVELSPDTRFQFFSVKEPKKIDGKSSQELQDTFSDWRSE